MPRFISRKLMCACCGVNEAVGHAPETTHLTTTKGVYEVKANDPICEPCANTLGWLFEEEE